tara:strand:+ start:2443 stop:2664 length:222 start_codon:yes stop_codon:yes gene_type:complete
MANKLDKAIDWAYDNEMKVLICILITIFIVGCTALNKKMMLKDDNLFEESCENLIESQIGIQLDLTPESPEKK